MSHPTQVKLTFNSSLLQSFCNMKSLTLDPTERIQYEVLVFDRILAYRREADGALRLAKFDLKAGAPKQTIGRDLTRAFKAESLAGAQTDGPIYRLEEAGPIDVSVAASPEYGFQHPAIGAVLTYNQSWYTQGLALGQLLHTVALALVRVHA